MTALFTRLNAAKASADPQAQQVVLGTLQKLMKENNVSPFRPLLMPLIQMPFFLAFFYSLRKLADLPLPQLKDGGFGWVSDLTVPDPYFILPITSMIFTNLVLRVSLFPFCVTKLMVSGRCRRHSLHELQPQHGPLQERSDGHVGRCHPLHWQDARREWRKISCVTIADGQAVLFYWTFTNLYSLFQAVLLRQPFVKSLLRIPSPPPAPPLPAGTAEPKQPTYAETWKALRETLSTKGAAWQEAKAKHQASLDVKERESGMRKGSALMVERVREKTAPGVSAPTVPAPSASWQETAGSERGGKEEAKARRVAAAREKRMRQ
jgi:YidC/Oxa1 family membrane protein insertase